MFAVMTTIIPQIFSKFTDYKAPRKNFYDPKLREPSNSFTKRYVCCYHQQDFTLAFQSSSKLLRDKDRFDEKIKKKTKRMVLVRSNNIKSNGGDGGGGGGGGGGGKDDGGKARVLGNLALAVGLIYLSLSGQLGWIIDAFVSFWLVVVFVIVVGFGALIWWARHNMVEIKCPNCRNEFEVFESMLNNELQLCPYCSQPFVVVDDEFVRDRMNFSKESTLFDEAFSDLFSRSKKGKASSRTVIDVEAEVKDAE